MSDFIPESYFEGGPPQSKIKPGDEQRELIHEIHNLNAGLALLQHLFQQFLPVLESLSNIDDRLHHLADAQDGPVAESQEAGGTSDGRGHGENPI